ncbi:hypothetical protein QBC44DRAFT_402379 [Cladorrhinum sp. PSN332]|nr:hypothetical protein QBC44DRAFT_402379 [Cladorrhinum sp. PSN332]
MKMKMKIPRLNFFPLLLLPSLAAAARNCTTAPQTIPFTISELTYDAPSAQSTNHSTVGLYLSPSGSGTYSCISTFPEPWKGRDPSTGALVWQNCILNIGRGVDDAVSFAIDWEAKKLYVGSTYTCLEGDGQTQRQRVVGRGEVNLEMECGVVEGRCLAKERRSSVDVVRSNAETNDDESPGCGDQGRKVSWEVEEHGGLWGYVPSGKKERLFVVSRLGSGRRRYECFDEEVVDLGNVGRGGRCKSVGEDEDDGGKEVKFVYRRDLKVLTIRESGKCGEDGSSSSSYEAVGVANVPVICFEYDVPICEVEGARFWVGGSVV